MFHRSEYGAATKPGTGLTEDKTLNRDTSFDSKMSKSTAFSSEKSTTFKERLHQTAKSFGTTVKRFDPQHEFKELFSRDPGPGQYSVISTAVDSAISGSAQATVKSFNTQGSGNGFVSKAERFAINGIEPAVDPKINVAPG